MVMNVREWNRAQNHPLVEWLPIKQLRFVEFAQQYMKESDGRWPTYKAFMDEFGWTSPNSVTQNIRALLKKGLIVKVGRGYQFKKDLPMMPEPGIPVKGVIKAGPMAEAIEADEGHISLDTLFPNLDRMFALRVSGQSMAGADIHDGDYVLLVDDDIPNGGIGAVLYNQETSLKRVYMDAEGLRLEPANPDFDNITIKPDLFEHVMMLGRYVGHVNKSGIHKHGTDPLRLTEAPQITRYRPN